MAKISTFNGKPISLAFGGKLIGIFKFVLVMSILLIFTGNPAQGQEKLVFSAVENSSLALMTHDVIKAAYQRIDIQATLDFKPGERALRIANEGEVDGAEIRVAAIQEKYKNLIMIPVPVYKTEIMVFSKNVDFPVNGWNSLKPYKIAAPTGYVAILRHLENHSRQTVTYEQIFKMLAADRVDIGVVDRFNGMKTINKLGLKGIEAISPPLKTIFFYNYLHKKHKNLVPKITDVLKEMEKAGEIKAIWQRHENSILIHPVSKSE